MAVQMRKWSIPNWFYWFVGIISLYTLLIILVLTGGEDSGYKAESQPVSNVTRLSMDLETTASYETHQIPLNVTIAKKSKKNESREDHVHLQRLTQSNDRANSTVKTISTKIIGHLGNHMFKYATTFCFAQKFNRTAVYNGTLLWMLFPYLSAQMQLPDEYNDESSHSHAGGGTFGECRLDEISNMLARAPKAKQHLLLGGYLQSWCYFKDCERELRKEFRFHPSLQAARNDFLLSQAKSNFGEHVQPSNVTFIAVHIRRGNFVKVGRVVAPPSYFDHAVDYMENVIRGSMLKMYVVASNDLLWARENFKAPNPVVYADEQISNFSKANFDFAILAGCNHTIMSVGTYSWWAAYMAGGTAVYYNVSPGANVTLEKKGAHFLPHWIGME